MTTIETLGRKLDKILKILQEERDKPQWVRFTTLMEITGISRDRIYDLSNDQNRRKVGSRYEYDLSAFKQIAK
jgi:hypothetical protein